MIDITTSTNVNRLSYVTYIKAPPLSQYFEIDGRAPQLPRKIYFSLFEFYFEF